MCWWPSSLYATASADSTVINSCPVIGGGRHVSNGQVWCLPRWMQYRTDSMWAPKTHSLHLHLKYKSMDAWFFLGINLARIFCAWPIWAEVTHYPGNNTMISPLSINRQLKFRITARSKMGIHTKKLEKIGNKAIMPTGSYFTRVKDVFCAQALGDGVTLQRHLSQNLNQPWSTYGVSMSWSKGQCVYKFILS